ncbi:MAG: Omp28-related outer membrane protein [Saprospiraceae bacterium]|nr:Omp28-related outer membrane protein [Saprospiraceae bacterium]
MKNVYLFIILCLATTTQAQSMKKYVLVEHFTNTRCPLCVSGNKTIYAAINSYEDNVHHISIHPSVPYENCALFQYNTLDNGARQAYYDINYTPQSFVDGEFVSNRVLAQNLETKILEKAGLQIIVSEGEGADRNIDVTISSEIDYPSGNYKLFVALLERDLEYDAPNGEAVHHDVLRDFLTAPDGDDINLPAAGENMTLQFQVQIPSDVAIAEAYTLAYIQNADDKEVLNSGTAADGTTSRNRNLTQAAGLTVSPNPVQSTMQVSVSNEHVIKRYEILNAAGQQLRSVPLSGILTQMDVSVDDLPQGTYVIRLELAEGFASQSFVKN